MRVALLHGYNVLGLNLIKTKGLFQLFGQRIRTPCMRNDDKGVLNRNRSFSSIIHPLISSIQMSKKPVGFYTNIKLRAIVHRLILYRNME